jgi:hypothetical protein
MGDGVFNIAKGRVVEYYNRVENNDPAASELVVMLGVGAITDATLKDLDTFAAIIADAGFTEATFTNYARKALGDAQLAALPAPDDTNDRYEVDIPDQVWSSAGNGTNNTLTRLIIGYDPLGTDVDANIVPLTYHDFAITTNGGDLTAQVDANGFFRAA